MHWKKEIFLQNVDFLRKQKGISLETLSTNCNVDSKYFSKLKTAGNTTVPKVDLVIAVANALEVNIDLLLNANLPSLSDDTIYKTNLLECMITRTRHNINIWTRKLVQTVDDVEGDDEPLNPIFKFVDVDGFFEAALNSPFSQDGLGTIDGAIYSTPLPEADKFCFITYGTFGKSSGHELHVVDLKKRTLTPITHSGESQIIRNHLAELYRTIEEVHTNNHLSKEVKNLLEETFFLPF